MDIAIPDAKVKRASNMKTTDIITRSYRAAICRAASLTRFIASAEIWESQWCVITDRYFVINPTFTGHLRGLVKTVRRQN